TTIYTLSLHDALPILVKNEVIEATQLCLNHGKIAKWIIEIAALNDEQIAEITKNISGWITENFPGKENMVFVKSSTGFYKTEGRSEEHTSELQSRENL